MAGRSGRFLSAIILKYSERKERQKMKQEKPNILFILTDDQGAWAMRCAGNTDIHTPSLDRIASQGVSV